MLAVLREELPAAIKLFGKTITLPPSDVAVNDQSSTAPVPDRALASDDPAEGDQSSEQQPAQNKQEVGACVLEDPTTPSTAGKKPKTLTGSGDGEDDEVDGSQMDQQVITKKPKKNIPCPRCDSTNTKFCYYNNYNTSQPRHFCRECQRYWTAGGVMRNLPVGSGRRKSKSSSSSSSSRCCPNVVFVASQIPDYRNFNDNMVSFGSGFPFQDLLERAKFCLQNGVGSRGREIREESSGVSSSVTSSSSPEKTVGIKGLMGHEGQGQGFQSQVNFTPTAQTRFPVSYYSAPTAWNCVNSTLGKHSRDEKSKRLDPYRWNPTESEETM
ncbi:hypothetical protein SAY87_016951 [Trapa incisa]|uniref:Dof-type domain-containing protein n=1 Tax=Trapa incisa TaxID=236973 RepID=A0AAN7QYH3_9MYRT|nr:hypothetical protein SAY87_016951 [Trapa incisa]